MPKKKSKIATVAKNATKHYGHADWQKMKLKVPVKDCKEDKSSSCSGKYVPTPESPNMCLHCMCQAIRDQMIKDIEYEPR